MSIWDEIDERDYLPFAKFEKDGQHTELYVQIIDSEPSLFKNRWGKEQLSIRVWCYKKQVKGNPKLIASGGEDDMWLLVGGVRLFRELKKAKEDNAILVIRRIGEGFQTHYKIVQKIKL